MSPLPRRRFLVSLAGCGVGLSAVATWNWHRTLGETSGPAPRHRVQRTSWALGSNVTMTALHQDAAVAETALEAAFAELETVEQVMSIYRPDSQLCQLNRTGLCDNPHPYLVDVLRAAGTMSRRTSGAFDVTIQPLWQAYWQAHLADRQPSVEEIAAARQAVDWRHVQVSEKRIQFQRPGMAVTLNGIAQGFAADRATAARRRRARRRPGCHGTRQPSADDDGAQGRSSEKPS